MQKLKKFGKGVFAVYFDIGVIALGLLAILVAFAVVMRYFFGKSWKELSEFNVTLFAFTTFWGMGINVIKGEHVRIDILYNALPPFMKKVFSIIEYVIMLIVDVVFTWMGYGYVQMAGKQISQGMEIPMKYMYGIMPLSGAICCLCIVIKLIESLAAPVSDFEKKEE